MLGGLIVQYTITQFDNSTIYYISSLLDLTDGKDFVAMEWSIVLERHPLDLMEWRWFSIVANRWFNDPLNPKVSIVEK